MHDGVQDTAITDGKSTIGTNAIKFAEFDGVLVTYGNATIEIARIYGANDIWQISRNIYGADAIGICAIASVLT